MDFMSGIWKVGAKAKEMLNLEKESTGEVQETSENNKAQSPVQEVGKGDEAKLAEAKRSSSPESEGPDSKPPTPDSPQENKVSKENIELDEASAQLPGVDLKQMKDVTKDVSHKAVEGAKYFGSFLYSVANKAGKTVSETAKQIKHTVEENSILGDFNREQEAFVKSRKESSDAAAKEPGVAPWVGCVDEESVKQQVLSLSADKRNFVRAPPSGVSFQFELNEMLPVAAVMLKEDPNLEKMRFELVPKHITEENFWRNYFYRVSLVKQSASLAHQKSSSGDSSDWSRKSSEDEGPDKIGAEEESPSQEFASDDHKGKTVSAKDLESGMSQLGVRPASKDKKDDDLEEELQQALEDFEVVNDAENDPELEQELERMIAS